ncbi:hypothetical protein Fmac_012630 [Flemingia macrophylla]|uniref:BHLH domain-containing protein n=1 Tax=Flemingia macrophylla TaxID=520843 RepID=A0ABD1MQV8_9FABA
MEEEAYSWENWHLHMEMDCENEDDFLRDILQPPPAPAFSSETDHSSHNSLMATSSDGAVLSKTPRRLCSSPKTFILSFDNSTMVPATSEHCLPSSSNNNSAQKVAAKRALSPEAGARPNKKARSSSQTVDHIMAERRRRQELTEKFITLSATIPGLNKTDKASVLGAAIDYVKELKERVQRLEKEDERRSIVKKRGPSGNGNDTESIILPEMEARVMGKEALIEIHCEKQNGIELKLLEHLESLHLNITASSVLPFGNSALCITITAQMGEAYNMTVDELVKNVKEVFSESNVLRVDSDPY